MALVTYPLNNIDYSAEDAELFHCTRTSGVFASDEDFSAEVSGTDNFVQIGKGIAWIRNSRFSGKVVANKDTFRVDMGLANGIYDRIDSIVLLFDANNNETRIVSKQGVAETSPNAPEVVRTEAVYELHLYHVYRRAGATSVLSSDITDLRENENYCGVMSDDVTMLGDDFVNKNMIGIANGVASLGTDGNVPSNQLGNVTPSLIGAVSKSGDTMTGSLNIESGEPNPGLVAKKNTAAGNAYFKWAGGGTIWGTQDISGDNNNFRQLTIKCKTSSGNVKNAVYLTEKIDGTQTNYTLYGEHNKPTPAALGAAVAASGTYTGNGQSRTISVGFHPKFVIITADAAGTHESARTCIVFNANSGAVVLDKVMNIFEITPVSNGFTLPATYFNVSGGQYDWAAFG